MNKSKNKTKPNANQVGIHPDPFSPISCFKPVDNLNILCCLRHMKKSKNKTKPNANQVGIHPQNESNGITKWDNKKNSTLNLTLVFPT
jgi:diketogulonate reductase-like aldo/keto reductase